LVEFSANTTVPTSCTKKIMEIRIDAIFASRSGEREIKYSDPQANHEEASGVLEDFKTALQVPGQSSTGCTHAGKIGIPFAGNADRQVTSRLLERKVGWHSRQSTSLRSA